MGFNVKDDWVVNISVNKWEIVFIGRFFSSVFFGRFILDLVWDLILELCFVVIIIVLEVEVYIFIFEKFRVIIRFKFFGDFSVCDYSIIL